MSSTPDPEPEQIDADTYRATIMWLWNHGKHFEAMRLLWRDKITDCPPTRRLIDALVNHRKLIVIGHAAASKTFTTVAFKFLRWLSNPSHTGLILTSSTIKSLSSRAWADMILLFRDSAVPMPGLLIGSQYKMKYDKLDNKHLIIGVSGESEDSVTKIQGTHPEILDLVIDEADNPYNVAIWKAVANLGATGEFRIVALANPMDRNSIFGMNCEPVGGWDAIDINSTFEWESRSGYHVIRLDGLQSPNILAGQVLYPFLLTPTGITDILAEFGENSPNYFTYVRAWFPDIGAINTMFTGTLVSKMEQQLIRYYDDATPVGACDPSLGGGNRCVVAIGKAGLLATDPRKGCVEVEKFVYIKHRDPSLPVTHDFALQIKEICLENGVLPENFAIGASVSDLGIRDYLSQFWSKDIVSVDPNGEAGMKKILQEDSRPPKERFDRRLTELWWACREWAKTGQLAVRELSRDLRIQLEARRWKNTESNKLRMETKDEMKKRGLKSPDEGDCLANLVELVRHKFGDLEATNLSFDPNLRPQNQPPYPAKNISNSWELFQPSYKQDPIIATTPEQPEIMNDRQYENQDLDY